MIFEKVINRNRRFYNVIMSSTLNNNKLIDFEDLLFFYEARSYSTFPKG